MISRKAFWSIALAVAVMGAGAGILVGNAFGPQAPANAAWKEVFEAPSQLARGVDSIVLAKAVGVEPGRVAKSDDGKDFLSHQIYEFEVVRGMKGIASGERVFVERAGGPGIVLDVDGGNYEMGATYLLFLNQQGDGPYHFQVNHQGRYLVDRGKLYGVDPTDSVSAFFEGRPLSESLSLVRGYLREGPMVN
jgi:hypothetical protein